MYMPYNGVPNSGFDTPSEEGVYVLETPGSNQLVAGEVYGPTSQGPWQKPRLNWTPTLHEKFVTAVSSLGGPDRAKPTAIIRTMETMGAFGLSTQHVKSHLQKYRNIHRQRRRETGEQAQDQAMVMDGANNIAPPPQPPHAAIPVVQENREARVENPVVNNARSNVNVQESPEDDDKWYINCLADNSCSMTVWEYINKRD